MASIVSEEMGKPSSGSFFFLPNSTNYSDPDYQYEISDVDTAELEKFVRIVVPIFFGLTVIVGFFGNLLVVVVVAANQLMRSTTNLLIFNLAIADLLFIIFCVPFTAFDFVLTSWPFGDLWCKMVQYLIVVTAYASVYTLVYMSFDRYLAVVHPITSISVRTEKNAVLGIIITWSVILLLSVPVSFKHGEVRYVYQSENRSACNFIKGEDDDNGKMIFHVIFFATSYAIPLALICGLYLRMLIRLWWGVAPGGHVSAEGRRGRRRVTRMVAVVVAIFAFCWCPIQVILVLKSMNLYPLTQTTVIIQVISHVLAYSNSCVNPILYAYLSENFRKAFRKVQPLKMPAAVMLAKRLEKPKVNTRSNTNNHIIYRNPRNSRNVMNRMSTQTQHNGHEKDTVTTKSSKINGDTL